jgi:IS30 family transposase
MELAKHSVLTEEFGMPVYFCDPQCPWQRGTNENTNSLIRQYFPKKTDLSPHSQARLSEVATQLNERPRKTLKFKTPSHMIECCFVGLNPQSLPLKCFYSSQAGEPLLSADGFLPVRA